uniref:heme-dependent oxidative N-demethylase subunit alpha family protein n=1 Tax=Mesobaculum littorinae TaxID=2486419 RepID=UPI002E26F16C
MADVPGEPPAHVPVGPAHTEIRSRAEARPGAEAPYLRSERQGLLRLPESRAVVFTIHTYMVRRAGPGTQL